MHDQWQATLKIRSRTHHTLIAAEHKSSDDVVEVEADFGRHLVQPSERSVAKRLQPDASFGLAGFLGKSRANFVRGEGSSPVRVLVRDFDERDVLSVALTVLALLPLGEDSLDPRFTRLDISLRRSSVDLE